MADSDFIIAGLGNPGSRYDATRHNAGFMALDHFISTEGGVLPADRKFDGYYCRKRFYGKQVVLVKPDTYMNHSGQCVAQFVRFFKIPFSNILILHDDLDKPFGTVKVVARGGAGGHNGIRSLKDHLGSHDFSRVKIGIGRPDQQDKGERIPVERYVLTKFAPSEMLELESVFSVIDQAIELFLAEGVEACMNVINRKG